MMRNNGNGLALATATLVAQYPLDSEQPQEVFERAVDKSDRLRRLQPVVVHRTENVIELRCEVEYGPDRGSDAELLRHLRRHLRREVAVGADDSDVFDFTHRLVTADDIRAQVAQLRSRTSDMSASLDERRHLRKLATRYERMLSKTSYGARQ
jgi:hypothetical protein